MENASNFNNYPIYTSGVRTIVRRITSLEFYRMDTLTYMLDNYEEIDIEFIYGLLPEVYHNGIFNFKYFYNKKEIMTEMLVDTIRRLAMEGQDYDVVENLDKLMQCATMDVKVTPLTDKEVMAYYDENFLKFYKYFKSRGKMAEGCIELMLFTMEFRNENRPDLKLPLKLSKTIRSILG